MGQAQSAWGGANEVEQKKLTSLETMYKRYKWAFAGIDDVLPTEVFAAHAQGRSIVFVDCRKDEEMAVSCIPGCITEAAFNILVSQAEKEDTAGEEGALPALLAPCTINSDAVLGPPVPPGASTAPAPPSAAAGATGAIESEAGPQEESQDDAPPPRPLVVMYCTVGARSGISVYRMGSRGAGVQVVNLAGSLLTWTHAGGRLVDPQGADTKKLHTYGEKWALAPEGYEQVWF